MVNTDLEAKSFDDARKKWALERELRPSKSACRCLHWIVDGRCNVTYCRANRSVYTWMDHVSAWTGKDGQRILVCQPYHIASAELESILTACSQFSLEAEIRSDGFYGHGSVCIELTIDPFDAKRKMYSK